MGFLAITGVQNAGGNVPVSDQDDDPQVRALSPSRDAVAMPRVSYDAVVAMTDRRRGAAACHSGEAGQKPYRRLLRQRHVNSR